MLYIHGIHWSFPILCSGNNKLDSEMNHQNKTSYKYDSEFQSALFNFMGGIDDIYDTLNLKMSDNEKDKIEEIRNRRIRNVKPEIF
jgi:hypothetical protein